MRVLIVDTFYTPYLQRLYSSGELSQQPWRSQHRAHFAGGFGTGNAYSHGLGLLGIEAIEIVANSIILQQSWAKEHQPQLLSQATGNQQLLMILEAQIRWWKPTVLYIQDINWLPAGFIRHSRQLTSVVIGQNACPLDPRLDLAPYDLMLTAVPHYIENFRNAGVQSDYLPIGFDQRILAKTQKPISKEHRLSFVGGVGGHHANGTLLLEAIAKELPIKIWGYGAEGLPADSIIRKSWQGEAWAEEMYSILANSQLTLNRHIDIAQAYACNMRLYEATGMGACLITDMKVNLPELFEIDREVVAYSSKEEAISKIRELMQNPELAEDIAQKGQARTLKSHNYEIHMQRLAEIIRKMLSKRQHKQNQAVKNPGQGSVDIGIYTPSMLFPEAKRWVDRIRENTNGKARFFFIVEGQAELQGEYAWQTTGSENASELSKAFFSSHNGISAVVFWHDGTTDNTSVLYKALTEETVASGMSTKAIRRA